MPRRLRTNHRRFEGKPLSSSSRRSRSITQAPLSPIPDQLPLGRDSIAWRVNAEPLVFTGGGRALLMQVAHPGVGAGVEQHSTYASDPWGRLFRTVDIMMKLSFGTPEESARQQRVLHAMHRKVKGTTDSGEPYSAFDSDLQVWVWATLVDTALMVYEMVQGRLPTAERERYYQESKLTAVGCGVAKDECPTTLADFEDYMDRVVAEKLRVTDSARRVAKAAMVPPVPLPDPLLGVLTRSNQLVTVGLMPASLREQFGYEWDDARQRRLDRQMRLMGGLSRVSPTSVRQLPAVVGVNRRKPLRVPWLQRRGAELTARRLDAFDREAAAAKTA